MCYICQKKESNTEMANVGKHASLNKKVTHFGKGENVVKNHVRIFNLSNIYNNSLNCFLSSSAKIMHKLHGCFYMYNGPELRNFLLNNFFLCKIQREQMPGSCSLRAHDR